jgi:uncharacterized damage-inducible protein DinB
VSDAALELLLRQHAHARWANRVLCAAIPAGLEAAWVQAAHIVASEEIWLQRIADGASPARDVFAADTAEGIARRLAELDRAWAALFARPTTLPERRIEYRRLDGAASAARLADLLTHVVVHGAYHRGQIALCLRAAGVPAPPTDFVVWQRLQP